jgi:hypothetical protein
MLRTALPGVTAAILLLAAIGATAVTAALAPNAASADHYSHAQAGKPAYFKGAILKHCLDNQGECALVVN